VSEDGGAHPLDRLRRELRLSDAVFLVVASVIGSGIFFTPGQVAALLPHPGWILAAWLAGGVISLAGALANAELGAMFPRAGGDYVYLREGVHPAAGFMVGWLTFGIIYTGTIAAVAAALAEAIAGPLGWSESATVALAIAATLACSALNFVGVRWGALANNITSIVKIAALLAFALLGPTIGDGQWSRVVSAPEQGGGEVTVWAFGLSMSPILFSYLGWNATIYVASEIREPGRNVPRSLFRGLGICTTVYLLVNAVYLYALPMTELRGVGDAGSAAAFALFGPVSATLVSLFVLISILGTLNATVLVGPRIAYAMALDGLFVGGAHRVTEAYRTPGIAIGIQAAVSCALLLVLRSFPNALDFTTFSILLAAIADVWALFRLRRLQPDRPRPYRAWGHPWLPGLYALVCSAIAVSLAVENPSESAIAVGMLLAGGPLYAWLKRRGGGSGPTPGGDGIPQLD
jgi:APA family basic amino acid/polyamine antiporter